MLLAEKEDTGHHQAVRLSIPHSLPQPHPSFPPQSWKPEGAVYVLNQRYNEKWVSRTYFAGFGSMQCLAEASPESFLFFLNQLRYDVTEYKENPFVPWKTRHLIVGTLLSRGYIHLMRLGGIFDDNATYYLIPSLISTVLTCTDLSHEKRWDCSLCCLECHADVRELSLISDIDAEKRFTSDGGPEGRRALVCCRAQRLLPEYYWGKRYHRLPEHD